MKWLLPSRPEKPWQGEYEQHGYGNVWSLTPDKPARDALLRHVPEEVRTVLIPGCGSETHLQRHLLAERPQLEAVYCTDRSQKALDLAQASFTDPKVRYRAEDTTALSYPEGTFDAVLVVNSILSSDDALNRAMIRDCHRVLKPGGTFVGYFPTIYCALDLSYLDPGFETARKAGAISLEESTFYEPTQDRHQIFYTPLRLVRVVKEAGFRRELFEIVFFDSDELQRETERLYGVPRGEDLFVWEILAVLRK